MANLRMNALDQLQTNVFFADADLNLTYINQKATQTLHTISQTLREELNLTVDSLLGINLDVIHKTRAKEIRAILANPKNFPYKSTIKLGAIFLELNVNVLYSEANLVEGYIVNWDDVTEKIQFAIEAIRFKQMVELAPINILFSTPDGVMTFMNKSSEKTLRTLERYLPGKVETLNNKSIDWFHKRPEVNRRIISDPKNLPHQAIIALGDQKLDLLVSPIVDLQSKYLGAMVTWSIVTEKLNLINDLSSTSTQLQDSALQLTGISNNLASSIEETTSQATSASSAGEEVNAGVQSVKSSMNQLVMAIQEITKATNEASHSSNEAMQLARQTNTVIDKLSQSSLDIGNVIKVISSIAQQTNLLALNATIEAARAGEAGKGFAVVANEVKELAKQSAKATNDITIKIENIQKDSISSVDAITKISLSIEKISSMTTNIASAVEEQAATTNEVTRVINESAIGVSTITQNIFQVSEASKNTRRDAAASRESAESLTKIASTLNAYVDKLKNTNI
jgi:methyl-accepting chemotaxis protein